MPEGTGSQQAGICRRDRLLSSLRQPSLTLFAAIFKYFASLSMPMTGDASLSSRAEGEAAERPALGVGPRRRLRLRRPRKPR